MKRVETLILIALGFNDMLTLAGHFESLPEKGRKEIEEITEEIKERGGKEKGK